MRLRNLVLPAGLLLLAACSGATTSTSTATEKSVGLDTAPKSCCHKDGAGDCAGKSDCAGKTDCSASTECPKAKAGATTNG